MHTLRFSILGPPGSEKLQALPGWSLLKWVLPSMFPKLGFAEQEGENEPSKPCAPILSTLEGSHRVEDRERTALSIHTIFEMVKKIKIKRWMGRKRLI